MWLDLKGFLLLKEFMKIERILGREIFDSRGQPTIQCQLFLDNGYFVEGSASSGVSLSSFEAKELRDGGDRLQGKGVQKAIESIEQEIAPCIIGREPAALEMDMDIIELDGTIDKSRLGSNAMLAVSKALYRAEALMQQMELYEFIAYLMGTNYVRLPFPFFSVINGARHAGNSLQIQEFMIVPIGARTFRSSLEVGIAAYQELKKLLEQNKKSISVGDDGGFSAGFSSDEEAFNYLNKVIEIVNKKFGTSCVIAIDVAASQYYDVETKLYSWNNKLVSSDEMIEYYNRLIDIYPIYSIEDGLSELDWSGWQTMSTFFLNKIQLVGDDIFATSVNRISRGIQDKIATSVMIKPSQVGTITETLQSIMLCKENNLNTLISGRAGDTDDAFIVDLSVGCNLTQIKAGAPCRGERISKYNRLLFIEDELMLGLSKP